MDNKQSTPHTTDTREQQPKQSTHKKRKNGWRKWLLRLLLLLLLLLVLTVGLLASGIGQRSLLKLADSLLDELKIEHISGSLAEGLVLENVEYHNKSINIAINKARTQLQFSCLWQYKLCIHDLSLQQLDLKLDTTHLPASTPQTSSPNMQRITLPLAIDINNITLQQLNAKIDQTTFNLDHFQTALSLNNQQGLTIQPTQIEKFKVDITAKADHQPTMPKQTKSAVHSEINWELLQHQLAQPLLANLQHITLPFDIHLLGLHGRNWQYTESGENGLNITIPTLDIKADASGHNVTLQQLGLTSNLVDLNAQGKMRLDQDFPLNLQLNANIYPLLQNAQIIFPQSAVQLKISGALKQQTTLNITTQGAIQANLNGHIQWNDAYNPFTLHLQSPQFEYPFNTQDPTSSNIRLQDLALQLEGDLSQYHINLQTAVSGKDIPPSKITLNADGTITDLTLHTLLIEALNGKAHLSSKLAWRDGFLWQSAVELDNINTHHYLPQWAATLHGQFNSHGQVRGENWQMTIDHLTINGQLNNQPLQLRGKLQSNTEQWLNAEQLKLVYGNNQIFINGHLNDTSNLQADINAPNLSGLIPHLNASLMGKINIRGSLQKPIADLDLNSKYIDYQHLQLRHFSLKGRLNMDEIIAGALYLNVGKFKYDNIELQQTKLIAEGNEKHHKLNLRTHGEPVSGTINIYGGFDRMHKIWQGTLSQIRLNSPLGTWHNNQNMHITFNAAQNKANIASHCWLNQQAQICFPQALTVGHHGAIPFELKQLNLAIIKPFLDKNSQLSGILNGSGNLAWYDDKPVEFNIALDSTQLDFKHKIDYRTFHIALHQLNVRSQIEHNNLLLKTSAIINQTGKLKTDLTISDLTTERQLSGAIHLQDFNLDLLNQLLAKGEHIQGSVNSHLRVNGTLQMPLLHGQFDINGIQTKLISTPFQVNDGQFNIAFNGNSSTLNGTLKTPDSQLNLSGNASWRSLAQWQAEIRTQADRFKLNIPGIAQLEVSPNVKASINPQLLSLTGHVDIPWARIEIEQLPESAIKVSDDLIIIDHKNPTSIRKALQDQALAQQAGMEISSNITLNIGNDVWLNAYGLQANLNGTLAVRQAKTLGLYGQVNILNGRYNSFGQDLLIRRGQVSFSGLASQPFLNIEAIRNPEAMENSKIVAGIKVTGLAEQPDVAVFAEPSVSQDEALSYLLTGRGLDSSGDSASSASIGAAMLGLGLSKSGKLVGGIGEAFGISELSLDTAGIGDNSQVVVSGNITPRLQIKYGVGLFQPLAELTLRYKILPQLFLQSVSGVNQAVDLLYQFEF